MKITGGQVKNRSLAHLKGSDIRPTSDRVREAIFDLIGQELADRNVLDLFAGTGSLGLEALSRGAAAALFVDRSLKAIHLIKKNVELCGFGHCTSVMRRDLRKGFPKSHPFLQEIFDLVFMDPPYREGFIPMVMMNLSHSMFLASGSLLVTESSKSECPEAVTGPFVMRDSRSYGDTRITIYSYEVEE
jgi:16S rRNA (guanine966-N2)-methyltransferase